MTFDKSNFVATCRTCLKAEVPVEAVKQLMHSILADPLALTTALDEKLPDLHLNADYAFLHRSEDLTILRVIMPAGLQSPPHNHLVWAVIGVYKGQEDNTFYRRKNGAIVEANRRECRIGEVIALPSDTIHRIANPLSDRSCSLQIYGGNLGNPARSLWNPSTLQEGQFTFDKFIACEREMTSGKNRST